jgi:2-polyprenyl-3-methyl-5-hydroxy-6-metoxy-1,4-benzoquinol methylase
LATWQTTPTSTTTTTCLLLCHLLCCLQELAMMAADAGLRLELLSGMSLQPGSGLFSLGQDTSINYAALLSKPLSAA